MARLILPICLLVASCSPTGQPGSEAALSFSKGGGAYAWRVGPGPKGRLELVSDNAGTSGTTMLAITCENVRTGALQARMFRAEPAPTALTLSARDRRMSVPSRLTRVGDQTVLEGEGDLPDGWAEALGATPTLKLRYGDQGVEVAGPGQALAAAFGRRCGG